MKEKVNKIKFSKSERKNAIGFGVGQIGSGLSFLFVSSYMLYFYTNIMEIPVAIAGTIFMVARIVDAVSDPLLGMLVDRTNTKIGKFRPYLRIGAPILGICLVLMFLAPDLSLEIKIVYAYTTYIMGSLARTIVDIPYHSIINILTNNPDKRSAMIGIKNILGVIGYVVVLPVMNYVKILGEGIFAWRTVAIVMAAIATLAYWICSRMIKDKDLYKQDFATEKKEDRISFKKQIKTIIKNRSILMLVLAFATDSMAGQMVLGVGVYYFLYNLNGLTDLYVLTLLPSVIGIFIAGAFLAKILKRTGKRELFFWSELILIIPTALIIFIPSTSVTLIIVILMLISFLQLFPQLAAWTMLPDCVDYAELKFGIKSSAAITSAFTFTNKLGQAFGVFITGIILSNLGFVEGAATQTEPVMKGILYLRTLAPIAAYIISLVALKFYPIKKADEIPLAEDIKALREKQKQSSAETI